MGHSPNFPCVMEDPNHDDRCVTAVPDGHVDLAQTLWFQLNNGSYWRTNRTAPAGYQVEWLRDSGVWAVSETYATEALFLAGMEGRWRELEPDEARRVAGGDR